MNNADFNELAGRIEGLAQAFRVLAFQLQQQGAIDRQQLQAKLRIHAEDWPANDQDTARRTLIHLADQMLGDVEEYRDRLQEKSSAPGR